MLGDAWRVRWWFRRGQALASQYRFEEAIQAFTQARAVRPRDAGLALHQALALAEVARFTDAVATMQEAIACQPANAVLPMFLGQIYFDQEAYRDAAVWCTRALALDAQNYHALGLQALLEVASGDVCTGSARLQQPLPLKLSWAERGALWLGGGRVPSLLQQANAALQSRVLVHAEAFCLRHAAHARSLAQQLSTLTPAQQGATLGQRVVAWLDRGLTRSVMGLRKGYASLRYRGQPDAREARLLALRATEAMYLGDYPTAQALYEALLPHTPDPAACHEQLFELCYEQGDFRTALTHWSSLEAPEQDASHQRAEYALVQGELYYQTGQYEAARHAFAQAAAQRMRDYKLAYYLGLEHIRTGDTRLARRHFADAVRLLNPDIATLRLGEMHRLALHLSGSDPMLAE